MATPWNIGTTVRPWSYGRVNEPSSSVQRHPSPQRGIAEIAKALRARDSVSAISMARRLAPFWSHVAGRNDKPALFAATVVVAAKLKDAAIAATLLQPFGLTALSGKAALQLTDLLSAYGIDWCRTLFSGVGIAAKERAAERSGRLDGIDVGDSLPGVV
jgi:hypothetical protein